MAHKFNPNASSIARAAGAIQTFVDAPVVDELTSVPQIGPVTKGHLEAAGVTSVPQLVGVFLTLREAGTSMAVHADKFAEWLEDKGVKAGQRDVVVAAIGRKVGEKFMVGYFDLSALQAAAAAAGGGASE